MTAHLDHENYTVSKLTNWITAGPTSEQLRAASGSLSQAAVGSLIGMSERTIQNWEAPLTSPSHRNMKPALYEILLIRIERLAAGAG